MLQFVYNIDPRRKTDQEKRNINKREREIKRERVCVCCILYKYLAQESESRK